MSIRVGVIGAGRIGTIHCANLSAMPGVATLAAIYDPMVNISPRDGVCITCDEGEFFNCDLDAVIIASPTDQHAHHLTRALEKNWHIFCEKPVDISLANHRRLSEHVHRTRCKVQIGFNRRFDRDFAKIAELNHQGVMGTPHMLRITSRDPGLPSLDYLRQSGGMFVDMTIHDFDMARFVMNSDITEVFAYGARRGDERLADFDDIDTAVITLKFENGAFGAIDNSRQAIYGYDQRIEIFGSLGSASNDHHRPHSVERNDAAGLSRVPMLSFFLERYQGSYQRELYAFFNAIKNDIAITPSILDAEHALMVALAAKESLHTNRPVMVR